MKDTAVPINYLYLDATLLLTFQVFLFMAQVSFLTSQDEKMRWVFQLMDLDETGLVMRLYLSGQNQKRRQ